MAVREKRTLKDDGVVLAASTKTVRGSIHGESRRGIVVPKANEIHMMAVRSPLSTVNQCGIAAEQVDGYINPLFYLLSVFISPFAFGLLPKLFRIYRMAFLLLPFSKCMCTQTYVPLSSAFRSFTPKSRSSSVMLPKKTTT